MATYYSSGILYVRRRQKNKRSSYGESRKITDNTRINYEKDGAAGVNIHIVNEAEDASEQQDDEIRVGKKDKKAKRAKPKTRASSLVTVTEEDELMDDVARDPARYPLIGRHSDPVSQGARHNCDGKCCAFCYTKKQCDVCNGKGF